MTYEMLAPHTARGTVLAPLKPYAYLSPYSAWMSAYCAGGDYFAPAQSIISAIRAYSHAAANGLKSATKREALAAAIAMLEVRDWRRKP